MDRSGIEQLFSRGSTPPGSTFQQQQPFPSVQQQPQQQQSPPPSRIDPPPSSSQNVIDALFPNLHSVSTASPDQLGLYDRPSHSNNSGPGSPMSASTAVLQTTVASGMSNAANGDRQSARLNLLGTVTSTPPAGSGVGTAQAGPSQQPVQQAPTPPNSSQQRMGLSSTNSESQGMFLLEQLMAGNPPRSHFSDVQRGPSATSGSSSAPSPPYVSPPTSQHDQDFHPEHSRDVSYGSIDVSREHPQRTDPAPQQPPSPTRRSMFDFVSPFDALASSSVKKKPLPTQPASSSNEDSSWTSVSIPASTTLDPKRKSVENLMDQLTRGQAPPPPAQAPALHVYDPYVGGPSPTELEQPRAAPPPPLPPKPPQESSPVGSPPRTFVQQRPQLRQGESPVGAAGIPPGKEKTSSPTPRGTWKGPEGRTKGTGSRSKNYASPSPQAQSILFDVSQPLDDIQAARESVKSTAIALVKVDQTFLPGTTIGATHWVAYAMTKGRVRVISRSSGDRTLLQLPSSFLPSSSVVDMAVYGNRLAGVTSDGGFVVWELPELITDDVPGRLLLCVVPSSDVDALRSVKWHPKKSDVLAIASETKIHLLTISEAAQAFGGEPIPQSDLHRIGQVFSMTSALVAFDFDVPHFAIATISEDSTLSLWNIRDKQPFWTFKIFGEGTPSSINFLDSGIVIGRKNGTVFQLLSVMGKTVLSTVKFVNGNREDNEMFGHVAYDSRIQTLWVANSRRDSMIAFKVCFEMSSPTPGGEDVIRSGYFEQVTEFAGPKPTIHFVILTADADPTGEEAHAACVAAKVPPGELALVAFSVHSTGVDQVLIRKEWFDSALAATPAKFPPFVPQESTRPVVYQESKGPRQSSQPPSSVPLPQPAVPEPEVSLAPLPTARLRTPPSEEVEIDVTREESRPTDTKGKGPKGKNVGWKDKDDNPKEKEKTSKGGDSAVLNDSPLGVALSKEIRKVEESLHTRIGRLIAKELDKQHHRLEEARANEQAADFVRQEKILKLISTELTKNTTRVVEMAVKGEVQTSVLPALETITKNEVKRGMDGQIAKGLSDSMKQSLPNEIEKLLLRPDISNHVARTFSSAITPVIERHVKDAITKTLIPAYTQQSMDMHQELSREIRSEILNLKKEVITWQSEALRGQEALIREMEQSIRTLSDQIKFMSMNLPVITQSQVSRSSPGTAHTVQHTQSSHPQMNPPHLRQPQPTSMPGPWFGSGASGHPLPLAPPPPPPLALPQPTAPPSEEWDDTYLAVLGTQDPKQLRELLARSNPEIIMPSNGGGPLSQAVVLTLVHRLSTAVGETSPADESFKSSLWWLQRAVFTLNTKDPLISPYTSRVLPSVHQMLNTTKQRLAILPGGPQLLDTTRLISEIQDTLSRKSM